MASNLIKINTRSPYFISALDSDEPVLAEYSQPATRTQYVSCGDEANVGTDVGTVIYQLDIDGRTGTPSITYTASIPIKFEFVFDGTTVTTNYYGDDAYEQTLLDAGVPQSELNGLGSGEQTGTINLPTRASDDPETYDIKVFAPYPTDKYKIVFNCPAAPAAPAEPDITVEFEDTQIIEPILGIILKRSVEYVKLAANRTNITNVVDDADGSTINLNGRLDRDSSAKKYMCILFTDYSRTEAPFTVGRSGKDAVFQNMQVVRASKSTYIKTFQNAIEVDKQAKGANSDFYILDTGVFQDEQNNKRIAVPAESDVYQFANDKADWTPGPPDYGVTTRNPSSEKNKVGIYTLDSPSVLSGLSFLSGTFSRCDFRFFWYQNNGFLQGLYNISKYAATGSLPISLQGKVQFNTEFI
jgi:hypothetical protein